ncbi:hypothetical protein AX774_g4733 [Zancudomyces culisetae]|uniref:Uncharacterized protein n=1 Tax=Zancudomyces culisetae TaxID=1213189 RepID=A0A1R1PKU9_ZANCU|nr:hypothetical protein AX774_g4937 [Zancudomyces culisetae]OMH81806.1 hypothetical protein AX774_g4733 [Zancudomyces culisetae]|eukprot:OMH81601.1 hypothetical protein AX774_g4937 [Zancudomyces culisetae]
MKALIDRLKTYDRSSEAKKVEERLIGYKQQLHALTEANSSDSSQINKVTKLLNAEKSSIFEIQYEERLMKIMFFHEHERYRRYKAFYYKIYNRLVGDFVKHHTLMLNAWKQSATPASFIPSDPEDFS